MFARIAAFEFRYQLSSPVLWVGFAIFFLLTFGATTLDEIQIGSRGNVNVNAPYAIAQTIGVMGVFGLFLVTAFVAGAVIRDDETGFAPILRATRVTKPAYVFGRFVGATAIGALAMTSVPLGMLLGSFMPWVDSAKVGPTVLQHYALAYAVVALPTLLLTSAAFFALATATRSLMWTYVGAVAMLVLFFVSRGLLRDPQFDTVSALSDPFGMSALNQATKYWTAAERNARLPEIAGLWLWNRLIWLGAAAALLGVAYAIFRMEGPADRPQRRWFGRKAAAAQADAPPAAVARPVSLARGDAGWAALGVIARFDAAWVFRSPAFFVLMAIGVLNSYGALWYANQFYGTEVLPVTRVMVQALQGAFTIIPIIIAVFYAGELVWRDRQQRMHDIVDATAAPDWVHLLPKIAAIVGVLFAAMLVSVLTAVGVQAVKGYTGFELGHYLLWYVLPQTVSAALIAVLAMFVQTLVPHKMIGWAAMLLYVVASIALGTAGFEHNLYNYGSAPGVPLSDMNGEGHFWIARAWFQAYWCAFALVLVLLSLVLRRRGADASLAPRLRRLPARLRGGAGVVLGAAGLAWAGLGGFIFYNTNVLNDYVPRPEREDLAAEYERTLLAFERVPQPRITDVTLDVELFPQARRAVTRGSYRIENRTGAPLKEVHVRWAPELHIDALDVPGATQTREWEKFNYRIYTFEPALAVGEQRTIAFTTRLEQVGFRNDAGPQRIVDNGSFLNNFEIAPMLGMGRDQLLQDRSKRRKHGLEPELRMAKLEDAAASANHYLRHDSDWVNAQIRLTTDADQIPVAPGTTVSDTTANGRRTLATRTDAPIQHFFSLQSGRYAVQRQAHASAGGNINLAVYFHPGHDANVPRMLKAMTVSLDLFGAAFSPFQFRQARVLEFPAYADFAQSFANTIPYSEGIGFIVNHTDDTKIDMVTYITAHEIAHQWWAHQVIGADKQGSTMLSESFSQYSALLVMERLYGRDQIRKFLKYELDRYLRARGGELIEELPLARVENQGYIHYQKGTLAMYWLKEVVGEAAVNRALKRLIEQYAFKPAPYPSSTDFLRLLREEAGPTHEGLITDLFEKITLIDAKTTEARASKRDDGRWDVTLTVEARKLYADGKGVETEAPLDEIGEFGVFAEEPSKAGFGPTSVLALERRHIKSGTQTLRFTVDRQPRFAGVDPYNKRIDRNSDDNLRPVE